MVQQQQVSDNFSNFYSGLSLLLGCESFSLKLDPVPKPLVYLKVAYLTLNKTRFKTVAAIHLLVIVYSN